MNESTKRTLIDHQDPQRIKWFNERIAGESLKQGGLRMNPVKTPTPSRSLPRREQWKVWASRHILSKPWLTVRQDTVELPNGHVIPEYFVFEYPDWVNVIPVTEDGRILGDKNQRIRDVRVGPDGYLYVLTDESDGQLLKVSPSGT